MDIYQAIWEADMNGNGIPAIFTTDKKDNVHGYVIVNPEGCSPEHHMMKEVYIPNRKKNSYQLIERLFDNYNLNQVDLERNNINESNETNDFLMFAIDSSPVKIARKFIEEQLNRTFDDQQWYQHLYDLWFRQFNWESGKDLSGFEHVFIGERKKNKLVGHHFWYKYWLEDNTLLNKLHQDQIEMTCTARNAQKPAIPQVIIAGYHIKAFDYAKKRFIKLIKKRCAFFVGISPEGLLALGTVRAMPEEFLPDYFVIKDVRFRLELYRSPDGRSIRTFYPTYVSPQEKADTKSSHKHLHE